ncbi:MAG: hypothetical protein U0235_05395 [Polyangiaceae bacterium]
MLLMCAVAYFILSKTIIAQHGEGSVLKTAVGGDRKGQISLAIYGAAIGLSFVNRFVGFALYWVVALIWLVPDRRIERALPE